ncbi:MAG: AAA family ATPase [Planctomycetes bacterium]|nr:AAA family ATPase [Planctomycetota bacterium]
MSTDDLLVTVSRLTGLPLAMLDEREVIDLTALRGFFERRVLGQPEAIDCLVERVAMVKAGLTDPSRPAGVFFFTGPTGTGKTALAKALAEYLFGSPDRMLRLDMSEFQTADSISRILGEGDELSNRSALADRVRQQPFSVLLLDEFEKAHPAVWDVFLQLFDDGRLTDRMGGVADFRHTIVIMTSNFGGDLSKAGSIGFSGERTSEVRRSLEREFRKEFLNRIDRVVVFQPLRRSVMRDILHKELDQVLSRRGLRNRAWAVEWEESAIEFLLDKGFTTDLGARPLKRAIERYLLAPLAMTIVDHRLPEGDQFLFVRSDGQQIDVVFVDPDAPEEAEAPPAAAVADGEALRLERVILDARGEPRELDFLEQEARRLADVLSGAEWKTRKQAALDAMATPSFWQSPGRFATLGLAEYMDRIEVGMKTAESLLGRLTHGKGQRAQSSPPILRRLALQVYLIDAALKGLEAGQPSDAFLLVESSRDAGSGVAATDHFASRIGNMYREWARKRGMRLETLEGPPQSGGYRLLLAVSGFAAFPILQGEHGLHVLEAPDASHGLVRHKVRVRVHPQPAEPARKPEDAVAQARAALAAEPDPVEIVRRYREEPSPLVRDAIRSWRTGRVDQVLAGDFDLIA